MSIYLKKPQAFSYHKGDIHQLICPVYGEGFSWKSEWLSIYWKNHWYDYQTLYQYLLAFLIIAS
jgi:hypothetical protein